MTITRAACALALVLCAAPGWAQYRCGNSFQDRPCDAGVPEQRIGSGSRAPAPATSAPAAAAPQNSPFAAVCARQGERAQQMAWKREGGATLDKQIAELHNDGQRSENEALLHSVYARRGSAPQIRSAIETECLAERQKQAEAAQMLRALQQQAGQQAPAPVRAPVSADADATQAQHAAARAAAAASSAKARCDSLRASKDLTESELRRGGSGRTMEVLQEERRRIEREMLGARC